MKLQILSDLHLDVADLTITETDADLIVLAGDIARPGRACAWAKGLGKPVVYVAGNHEFYGSNLEVTVRELRAELAGTNVHFLEADEQIIAGVRFLGTTLWTDFLLFGDSERRDMAIAQAKVMMRDFSRIRVGSPIDRLFEPQDSVALFDRSASWLRKKLAQPFNGATVVVTHHSPSPKSIHPRFSQSLINTCFVSDAQDLLSADRVQLWIHGHTHDTFDYEVNGTRVLCNPRGYAKHGANENQAFDPALVVVV
jgi:predicted phosphodiesterase